MLINLDVTQLLCDRAHILLHLGLWAAGLTPYTTPTLWRNLTQGIELPRETCFSKGELKSQVTQLGKRASSRVGKAMITLILALLAVRNFPGKSWVRFSGLVEATLVGAKGSSLHFCVYSLSSHLRFQSGRMLSSVFELADVLWASGFERVGLRFSVL